MSIWSNVRAFLRYRRRAISKHGVHSPFVFELITKTLPAKKGNREHYMAEDWRESCIASSETIEVKDLGTGISGPRSIASIAKKAGKSPKQGRLLFRLVKRFQPKTILELGTSLGISALYMNQAAPEAKFITIEGCPETAKKAREQFTNLKAGIEVRTGNFNAVLTTALADLKTIDFVYIDGNHRKQPTLDYFNQIRQYANNETVFIFDDIHWSLEMEEAWATICADESMHVTIDVFHFGIAFIRKEQVKEHFVLRW